MKMAIILFFVILAACSGQTPEPSDLPPVTYREAVEIHFCTYEDGREMLYVFGWDVGWLYTPDDASALPGNLLRQSDGRTERFSRIDELQAGKMMDGKDDGRFHCSTFLQGEE